MMIQSKREGEGEFVGVCKHLTRDIEIVLRLGCGGGVSVGSSPTASCSEKLFTFPPIVKTTRKARTTHLFCNTVALIPPEDHRFFAAKNNRNIIIIIFFFHHFFLEVFFVLPENLPGSGVRMPLYGWSSRELLLWKVYNETIYRNYSKPSGAHGTRPVQLPHLNEARSGVDEVLWKM
eukprot:scaffold5237_cov179-Amphora_coffeaeformis.AAC.1